MSSVKPDRSYSRLYTIIKCPCGSDLRVKRALAGTEVRCWACHQMVMVPIPPTSGLVARAVGLGLVEVSRKEVIAATGVAAAVVTALLYASEAGAPYAAAAAMIAAAVGYGELIRLSDLNSLPPAEEDDEDEEAPDDARGRPSRYAWFVFRGLAAVVVGLSVSAPWLITPRDFEHLPRLTKPAQILLLAGSVGLPLLMLLAYAQDSTGPLGLRRAVRAIVRHPLVLLASLVLLPLGMVLAETMTVAFTSFIGWFPFVLLEIFPGSERLCNRLGIPWTVDHYIGGWPGPRYYRLYEIRLAQGYTMLGALPHSLGLQRFQLGFPWGAPVLTHAYLFLRSWLTLGMLWIIFWLLALQARWLGVLATFDSRPPEV